LKSVLSPVLLGCRFVLNCLVFILDRFVEKTDCCLIQHQITSDSYVIVSYKLNANITSTYQSVTTLVESYVERSVVINGKSVMRNVKCYFQLNEESFFSFER